MNHFDAVLRVNRQGGDGGCGCEWIVHELQKARCRRSSVSIQNPQEVALDIPLQTRCVDTQCEVFPAFIQAIRPFDCEKPGPTNAIYAPWPVLKTTLDVEEVRNLDLVRTELHQGDDLLTWRRRRPLTVQPELARDESETMRVLRTSLLASKRSWTDKKNSFWYKDN